MNTTKDITWFYNYIEKKFKNGNNCIPTGFITLDSIIDGFIPGTLITIGARPGTGKTTLLLNFLKNQKNFKPLIFTTEITKERFLEKFISIVSDVDYSSLRRLDKTLVTVNNLNEWMKTIQQYNIVFNDEFKPNILTIKESIERHNPNILYFDYFQNIKINTLNSSQYFEFTKKVEDLVNISKEYNIPVVITSQLKRFTEDKPSLSDLKETGKLEEASHLVMLLWQEAGDLIINIAKNRDGMTGELRFKGDWSKNRLYE